MRIEVCLRADDGTVLPLEVERWHDDPGPDELAVLDRVRPPVVDLGCGPGRHLVALAERGIPVLGVDAAPAAVAAARARGAAVLERSVFGRIPGKGRWGTALLLDGNIGIGGDPVRLLGRVAGLVRGDGQALVEVGPPGSPSRPLQVRMERNGIVGPIFTWAVVGVDGLADAASRAGLRVGDVWRGGDRWFSQLLHA